MTTRIAVVACLATIFSAFNPVQAKAEAPNMSAVIVNSVCRQDGDTRVYIRVDNYENSWRRFNYWLYPSDIFMAWGDAPVAPRKHKRVHYDMRGDTTMEVYVYSDMNQKNELLHTTVTALDCT